MKKLNILLLLLEICLLSRDAFGQQPNPGKYNIIITEPAHEIMALIT